MQITGADEGAEHRSGGLLNRTPPYASGLLVAISFLLVSGSLLGLLGYFGTRQHDRIAEERMRGLAAAAAPLVDGVLHETLREPQDTGSELYERAVYRLVEFHNLLPEVYRVRTMRVFEGRLFHVLDTAASPRLTLVHDKNRVSRVMDPVLDLNLGVEPDLLPTILSGAVYVELRTLRSGGKIYRSVEAPIDDAKGNVVGMLVLDIEVGAYRAERDSFVLLVQVGAGVCLGLALFAGLITSRLHNSLLQAVSRLERESITDALTGLGNRALFNRALGAGMAQARRSSAPFTLLVFDIDRFKRVNDELGHPAGDEVLRRLGERLRPEVREGDLCCRIGGEEFALLMPGIGRQEGEAAFNRMSAAIRVPMFIEGAERVITISGGVATMNGPDARPEEILRDADRALYVAKRGGRDRVVLAA